MTYVATYDADYLEHHGILGQKWGTRRYQNPDGSYTAAGAANGGRYSGSSASSGSKGSSSSSRGRAASSTSVEAPATTRLDTAINGAKTLTYVAEIPFGVINAGTAFATGNLAMGAKYTATTLLASANLIKAGVDFIKTKVS